MILEGAIAVEELGGAVQDKGRNAKSGVDCPVYAAPTGL
jgi:hypothetical protein